MSDTREWKSVELSHEGFPLLVRYPAETGIDQFKEQFPLLAVITHEFSEVRGDGLPEPGYNNSLFGFDKGIRSAFEEEGFGLCVLIETFAGKRSYYLYVTAHVGVSHALSAICSRYPREKISSETRPDPEWGFIKRYRQNTLREK